MYGIVVLISIIEGLTEFIPVSSTGHMIIAGHMLGFTGPRADAFEVFIQLGAILAVVGLYWQRFLALIPLASIQAYSNKLKMPMNPNLGNANIAAINPGFGGFSGWRGIGLLILTSLPALIAGKLAHDFIKEYLFSPITVAMGLALGGLGLILIEKFRPQPKINSVEAIGWREALAIGLFQCLALWPGMSRSGSTIIGGMLMKMDRKVTAEYSFLAAVPIMFAATGYDLYKSRAFLTISDAPLFALGFLVSLISAWIAIRYFIQFLTSHTLKVFGWYRIVLALLTYWYFSGR